MNIDVLDAAIRRVKDFPKPGITFYDVTGILADPEAYRIAIEGLVEIARKHAVDAVTAIEARGFVFGAPLAQQLSLPLVLARKPGKLPNAVRTRTFDLEYGSDTICIQEVDLVPGRRYLIIDDLVATGGTLKACCSLITEAGGEVAGIAAIIGLPFLDYKKVLAPHTVDTLINFHGE